MLVAASIAAMLSFEVTRGNARRRGVLAAVVAVGYVALLWLRTDFLATVTGESLLVSLLQSTLLIAISAGLILCGAAVLARTRPRRLSRAHAAARRARRAAADARAARIRATEELQIRLAFLSETVLPWALSSAAASGIESAKWITALERAIRALYPTP
jgi:hypothetical protein